MNETEIAVVAEQIEAEVLRSRLEADGIPVRIVPKSQVGMPASWSPRGLGFPVGSFGVRVPDRQARRAREILGIEDDAAADAPDDEDLAPRASPVRIIATLLLIGFLLSILVPVAQLLGADR